MSALQRGVITRAARIDIVSAMHTVMMQYEPYPTSYIYQTACKRLLAKFPLIKDKTASGFVS